MTLKPNKNTALIVWCSITLMVHAKKNMLELEIKYQISEHKFYTTITWSKQSTRSCRLRKLPNSRGMLPSILLLYKNRLVRLLQRPISGGIFPVSLFSMRCRVCMFIKFPMLGGIIPDNWFPLRSNAVNAFNFPIVSGIEPSNLLE